MISTKFGNFALLITLVLFAIASMVSAEDKWVLLHRDQRGQRDVYYDRQSIKQVNNGIMEVYIKAVYADNRHSVHQVQVDRDNQKLATGLSLFYVKGSRTEKMDFSKPVWVWFPPMNVADKKLLNLVGTKN